MKLIPVVLLLLVTLIGCNGSSQTQSPTQIDEQINTLLEEIERLEGKVTELKEQQAKSGGGGAKAESQEAEPQWTEQQAISVVKQAFQVSMSDCAGQTPLTQRGCYLSDPVTSTPDRFVGELTTLITERVLSDDIQWSAAFDGEQEAWRVEGGSVLLDPPAVFYVYEKTGLVVRVLSAETTRSP